MSQQVDVIDDQQDQPVEPAAHANADDALLTERYAFSEWVWLLVCTLLGAALRVINLAGRPLWADELTTIITAGRPLGESFTTEQDPQPPLYQLLVRLFNSNLAGSPTPGINMPSEAVLRAPAALFGTLTIAAAWWCARHFLGRIGAAIMALLVAVNPLLVHHSRDARPYALFTCFACLAIAFGYRLAKTGRTRDIVGYAVATAGMFLSHYYAMFLVAAQLCYYALDFLLGGPTRRHRWRVLAGLVTAFILSLPPLILFYRLTTGGMKGSWWIGEPTGIIHAFDALGDMLGVRALGILCIIPLLAAFWLPGQLRWRRRIAGGTDKRSPRSLSVGSTREGHTDKASEQSLSVPPKPALPPKSTPTLSRATFVAWWLGKERAIYLALFVGFALFVPVIVSLLLKPAWVMRYSLPVVIAMLILGLAYLRSVGPAVTIMVLALLVGMGLHKSRGEMKGEPGLRDAVTVIMQHKADGDTVFLPDWRFAPDFVHPEGLGLPYYGYTGPYTTTNVEHFYSYNVGASKKLPAEQVKHILANPHELLPQGRTWAICFYSTATPIRDFLIRRGRLFSEWEFGRYIDGGKPMYTLFRIEPANVRPVP